MSETQSASPSRLEPGEVWTYAALSMIYAAAAASAYVVPIIGGAFAERLGFRVEDLGYILSVELATITIGAFVLYPRIGQSGSRAILAGAMLVIVAANLACAWTGDGKMFIGLRAVAGLAEGVAQAAALAAGARARSPERAFTVIYTFLTLVLAAIFLGLPAVMASMGYAAALFALAGLGAAGLLFSLRALDVAPAPDQTSTFGRWSLDHALVLIAWLAFIIGQYALFVYAERIADHIGIGFEETSLIFAIGSVATIPAPWVAGWAMARFGLAGPVIFATLLSAISIVGFPLSHSAIVFGLVFLAFNCAVFFAFPLISTLGARVDASGRLASLLPAAQAVGMAMGPVIASATLGLVHNYLVLAIIASVISLAALLAAPPAARADKATAPGAASPLPLAVD